MVTDMQIRASARRILATHGAAAWPHAVARTEALAMAGDWGQVAVWRRIGGAIRSLERASSREKPLLAAGLATLWFGRTASLPLG